MKKKKIQYVVSERDYIYNDEGYTAEEGGSPVKIFQTLAEADKFKEQALIKSVQEGWMIPFEDTYFTGEALDRYFAFVGGKYIEVHESTWKGSTTKYGRAKEFPKMSKWSDKKILEFLELFEDFQHPYFITPITSE